MLRWASWMRTKACSPDVSTRTVGLSTRLALPAPGAVRGVRAAIKLARVSVGRTVKPSALAEGMYRREILPWGLLGLALGLVEGATAAVLVKRHFAGVAPRFVVNLAVALVSGAPAFSNVLSFVWANVAHGRARVRLMVALQGTFALFVGCVAFASHAAAGLVITVLSIVAARVLWGDRKSTRLNSSHQIISYAVFCLKKKI